MSKRHPPIRTEYQQANGWTRWIRPIPKGYLMACCDCHLTHRMEFRVNGGRVEFRVQRAPKITRIERKRHGVGNE